MARKVYTVEFDDVNLASTAGSKASKVASSESQKVVETYGIVEINNNSSKKKIKSTKEAGFEKNVMGTERKAVKSNIAQIDDYFDFSFRPCAKVEEVSKSVEVAAESQKDKKVAAKKATTKKVAKTASCKTKTESKTEIINDARACETYTMNDEARKIISVARAGSLFG